MDDDLLGGAASIEDTEVTGNPDPAELENEGAGDEGVAPEAFDWTAVADRTVTIKVDGQDVVVPLSEALNGYSRQADYTRKAQDLAAQREQLKSVATLKAMLEDDPKATLAYLQSYYGDTAETVDEDADLTPIERELNELKAWRATQEQTAQRTATTNAANAALAQHGLADTTTDALLAYAMERQIFDLSTAARLMKFEAAEAKTAALKPIVEAKRAAAVVAGGSNRTAAAAAPVAPQTMAESYALAKQQLGYTG